MLEKLKVLNWSPVLLEDDIKAATNKFYSIVLKKKYFPVRRVKLSLRDPLFMSPLLKYLLSGRNKLLRKGFMNEAERLQPRITQLIKGNQLNMVKASKRK